MAGAASRLPGDHRGCSQPPLGRNEARGMDPPPRGTAAGGDGIRPAGIAAQDGAAHRLDTFSRVAAGDSCEEAPALHRLNVRTGAAVVALLAVVAVGLGAVVHYSSGSTKRAASTAQPLAEQAGRLPPPERPAFRVGAPKLLSPHETRARFAPVARLIEARSEPTTAARTVAPLELRTPEGTTNIVLVVGDRVRPDGLWVRVRLPVLPNDRTGWVPRHALGGYQF